MKEDEIPAEWWNMSREQLEKVVPHGSYQLGSDRFLIMTGKGGVINYILTLRKKLEEIKNEFIKNKT